MARQIAITLALALIGPVAALGQEPVLRWKALEGKDPLYLTITSRTTTIYRPDDAAKKSTVHRDGTYWVELTPMGMKDDRAVLKVVPLRAKGEETSDFFQFKYDLFEPPTGANSFSRGWECQIGAEYIITVNLRNLEVEKLDGMDDILPFKKQIDKVLATTSKLSKEQLLAGLKNTEAIDIDPKGDVAKQIETQLKQNYQRHIRKSQLGLRGLVQDLVGCVPPNGVIPKAKAWQQPSRHLLGVSLTSCIGKSTYSHSGKKKRLDLITFESDFTVEPPNTGGNAPEKLPEVIRSDQRRRGKIHFNSEAGRIERFDLELGYTLKVVDKTTKKVLENLAREQDTRVTVSEVNPLQK